MGLKVQLLQAMMQEMEQRAGELSGDSIQTIYFGAVRRRSFLPQK